MSTKDRAIEGIDTAISVLSETRAKIEKVIATKVFEGKNVDRERAEKASINRKLANLRQRKVELEAAAEVVSAPTVTEISEMKTLITKIKNLALEDAMRASGLQVLTDAVARAMEVAGKARA